MFVGSGALIAGRSAGARRAGEINDIRWVVTTAMPFVGVLGLRRPAGG